MAVGMSFERVVVIGQGKWGGALGQCFVDAKNEVQYLDLVHSETDWAKALERPSVVVLATPFSAVSEQLKKLNSYSQIRFVLNASKGIDRHSLLSFSALAKPQLRKPFGSLSGPTFAQELKERKPTAAVIAGRHSAWTRLLCQKLSTDYFRLYSHRDPVGVEVCGAVKNVLAIACGVSDGLGMGQNARAALLSRGLLEMMKVVKVLKGNVTSVFGLAGVGDLWLTATGSLSRNRRLGELLARGHSAKTALEEISETVEGYYTVEQVEKLRKRRKLDLPICEKVFGLCFKGVSAQQALKDLMSRSLKTEESSQWKLKI